RGLRSRGDHEPRKDLPGWRCLRRHSDGAYEASTRGGHVGLALRPDARAVDGIVPRDVVRATSEGEVVDAIRGANERVETVVVSGGATRRGVGDPPTRYEVGLDLSALSGVVEYEPAGHVDTDRACAS